MNSFILLPFHSPALSPFQFQFWRNLYLSKMKRKNSLQMVCVCVCVCVARGVECEYVHPFSSANNTKNAKKEFGLVNPSFRILLFSVFLEINRK